MSRSIRSGALLFAVCLFTAEISRSEPQVLFDWPGFLSHAHSHNDYEQRRPLKDALESKLSSVEADLWLENGVILVGHERGKWRGELEALYLRPLQEAWVQGSLPTLKGEEFLLWLDIKDAAAALRQELHRLLALYPAFSSLDAARPPLRVILTGNKESKEAYIAEYPLDLITRDSNQFSEEDPPASRTWSWYALDWRKLGQWDGKGSVPSAELDRLSRLAAKIHAKGRRLRLWSHPDTLAFWREAVAAGVE